MKDGRTAGMPLKEKLAFGAGAFGKDFVYLFITLYILYFFTDVLQISAVTAGTILLVVRLIDAGFDLPFGFAVDKTRSRWGKLRPYLLFGAIPYGIVTALLFYTPDLSGSGKIYYAFSFYLLISILYSVISIPHAALNTVMTDSMKERAQLSTILLIFSGMAITLVSSVTLPIVALFPNEQAGYLFMGATVGLVAIVLILVCFKGTSEQIADSERQAAIPFKVAIRTIFTNKPYLALSVSFFMLQVCFGVRGAASIYYFIYNVGNVNLFSMVSLVGGLAGLGLQFFAPAFIMKFGKRSLYIWTGVLLIADLAAIYMAPTGSVPLVFILNTLASILAGLSMLAAWASLPDAIDYSVRRNGLHIEGMYYSLYNFLQKLGSSVAGGLSGVVLAAYGYQTGGAPTADSLEGIRVTSTLIPAACAVVFTIAMLFYRTHRTEPANAGTEGSVIHGQ
ncbi:MFS transporter [Cohnella nanjingensis]|uniref:MFS transporter n=1 Tax=Cohnella nanjingensis TaxID=1387779 RepID=A0A7X0RRT7_9BACL|nr:MFS transporter [Cohnella nanjingensis]MBB6672380.1 MFS transporter [Cohnella nanjingensis]